MFIITGSPALSAQHNQLAVASAWLMHIKSLEDMRPLTYDCSIQRGGETGKQVRILGGGGGGGGGGWDY